MQNFSMSAVAATDGDGYSIFWVSKSWLCCVSMSINFMSSGTSGSPVGELADDPAGRPAPSCLPVHHSYAHAHVRFALPVAWQPTCRPPVHYRCEVCNCFCNNRKKEKALRPNKNCKANSFYADLLNDQKRSIRS